MDTGSHKSISRSAIILILKFSIIVMFPTYANSQNAEGTRAGATVIFPFASLLVGHDDNVQSQETGAQESSVSIVSAGFELQVLPNNGKGYFDFAAEAEKARYASSSEDDYSDNRVSIGYVHQPNDMMELSVNAGVDELHDSRTPRTLATRSSLDEFEDKSIRSEFYYGVDDYEGADVSISIGSVDRRYQSDRVINADKERDSIEIAALMRFPVAPNTRLRLSARQIEYDYNTAEDRDSQQLRLMIGADWQLSEITQLSAEFGRQEKEFKQSINDDDSESSWEIGLTWKPESYNSIEFTSRSDINESITDASHVRVRSYELIWQYEWEEYFSTEMLVGNRQEVSVFSGPNSIDDVDYLSLDLRYDFRETIQLTAGLSDTRISSDAVGNSSDRTILSLGVVAAF